jgi:hypothetical protein
MRNGIFMINPKTEELQKARTIALEKFNAVKPSLELRLQKRGSSSSRMEYGQIKRSARHTMKTLGYEWILKQDGEDKYVTMFIKRELRRVVKTVVGNWHENPSRVWLQFQNYCLEMASANAARKELKKFRITH